MPRFSAGDYIKVEFVEDRTGESEWMWVRVDSCNDNSRLVFGRLDSQPILDHRGKLKLGSRLAVSYDNVREHRGRTDAAETDNGAIRN